MSSTAPFGVWNDDRWQPGKSGPKTHRVQEITVDTDEKTAGKGSQTEHDP